MLRTDEGQELQAQLDESRTRIRDLQVELLRSIEERHTLRQRQLDTGVGGGPTPIDVIVPVYRGLAELKRCLGSVLTQRQQVPYELVVVDDCSPEPEISAYLDELAAKDMRVTLLRTDTNIGFPATANRGMSLPPGRDVVLLNSDTEVANDWRRRRHGHAVHQQRDDLQLPELLPGQRAAGGHDDQPDRRGLRRRERGPRCRNPDGGGLLHVHPPWLPRPGRDVR
jgi:hypothetical protein